MTHETDTELDQRTRDELQPPCEVRAHRCGQPDRECELPADWIDRYRCACPTPANMLTCEGHHNLLPILVQDHICAVCCHPPILLGGERI
jgi:hypothetical protein